MGIGPIGCESVFRVDSESEFEPEFDSEFESDSSSEPGEICLC
jgi:hypothetical protein